MVVGRTERARCEIHTALSPRPPPARPVLFCVVVPHIFIIVVFLQEGFFCHASVSSKGKTNELLPFARSAPADLPRVL